MVTNVYLVREISVKGTYNLRCVVTAFDPAASFLLTMPFENLFEAIPNERFRCKGCGEIVARADRKKHRDQHLRSLERDAKKRQEKIRSDRVKNLAKARAVKARAVSR